MMTTSEEIHFYKPISLASPYDTILEHSLLGILHLVVVGIRLVLSLVAYKPMLKCSLVGRRTIGHHSPISLVHLTLAKHIA